MQVTGEPARGVRDLSTQGGEAVTVYGKNLGPSIGALDSVSYRNSRLANSTTFTVDVRGCVMLEPHESVSCHTVVGAGQSLEWVLVVAGQESSNPSTSYAPPFVAAIVPAAAGVDVGALPTNGGASVWLVGTNFGPEHQSPDALTSFLDAVTYGPTSTEYTPSAAVVRACAPLRVCVECACLCVRVRMCGAACGP